MTSNIEIIVGTYEKFLLGYKLDKKNDEDVLSQTFADKSHSGSIKCVAVHDRWVATGSADDRIIIYDMRTRKQSQILITHEGTINSLAFTPDNTHLISGGDDGRIIATRLTTWFTEATWKQAHDGAVVTHICCHPSGKLMLSLGADLVLRTWNLVKGRVAYKTNLKSRNTLGSMPEGLAWSSAGDYFSICGQRVVELWSIKTAAVVRSQKTAAKPVSVCWIANETCLVGLEDGQILWITLNGAEEKETAIKAHDARVKTMAFKSDVLVTASSSGEVKLWRVNEGEKKLIEVASINIGCRPTCIGILDLEQFGPDYQIGSTVIVKQEIKKKLQKAAKPRRGVVTIEYEGEGHSDSADAKENDTNDENEEEASDIEKKEGDVEDNDDEEATDNEKEESDVPDTNNADANDSEKEEGDVVDKEEEASKSENTSESSDDDAEGRPQIRMPKSRKRKQQILRTQQKSQPKIVTKKQKLNGSEKEARKTNTATATRKKNKKF